MSNKLKAKIINKAGTNTYRVLIERRVRHPLYGKSVTKSNKILVNTNNNFETGDFVIIEETKPISKNISFVIKEKVI